MEPTSQYYNTIKMKFALTFVILLVFSIYHNNNASPTSIRTFEEFKVSLLHSHFFTPLIDHFLGSDNSINNTKVLNMRKLHEKISKKHCNTFKPIKIRQSSMNMLIWFVYFTITMIMID